MLYTPVPGTPLYQEMTEKGCLLSDVDFADMHGQFKFNFSMRAISREDSNAFSIGPSARLRTQRAQPLSDLPRTTLQRLAARQGKRT